MSNIYEVRYAVTNDEKKDKKIQSKVSSETSDKFRTN